MSLENKENTWFLASEMVGEAYQHKATEATAAPDVKKSRRLPHSQIGMTTPFMPHSSKDDADSSLSWYALRTTYGREQVASSYMRDHGCEVFLPTVSRVSVVDGRRTVNTASRIPNLFFAYGTEDSIKMFVYDNVNLPYLRFYYRYYTLGNRREKEPLIVPRRQMETLRIICETDADDVLLQSESVDKFRQGDKVRIVDGPFKGVEGVVARYKGQQRVGVVIGGILTAATTYIPTPYLQYIEKAE